MLRPKAVYNYDIRNSSYFRHKYSPEVEAAVNKQIKAEQQAGQDYLNMAVYFLHPAVSRPGAGGFFMKMYNEEVRHMQDFIQYQLLRGGTVCIDGLSAPKQSAGISLLQAFKTGLEMEKCVTELLLDLVSAAESVKDYQCADYVTSVFLADQMKSLNEFSHHVTRLSRLSDENSFYLYDLELAKTYPYTYKKAPS
ncbi:ferritin-like domain-containing protein [Phthorimaea operculella]|nr:ferritin-like domain-containing protein [Phthorimaea operculella]